MRCQNEPRAARTHSRQALMPIGAVSVNKVKVARADEFHAISQVSKVDGTIRRQVLLHRAMLEKEEFALMPARTHLFRQPYHKGFHTTDLTPFISQQYFH